MFPIKRMLNCTLFNLKQFFYDKVLFEPFLILCCNYSYGGLKFSKKIRKPDRAKEKNFFFLSFPLLRANSWKKKKFFIFFHRPESAKLAMRMPVVIYIYIYINYNFCRLLRALQL